MGGRGSASKVSQGYGRRNLEAAFGKRGDPIDRKNAMKLSNPNYYTKNTDEYTRNCQRCVYAYEMQRRGYNVEARERILDGTDELPYQNSPNGWSHVMQGQQLVSMPGRGTKQKILDQMLEWGDGARAIVKLRWKDSDSGHVFIAEQDAKGTVFLDPQTGHYVDIGDDLKYAVKKETKLSRIDNLQPTKLIEKCVKKRGT